MHIQYSNEMQVGDTDGVIYVWFALNFTLQSQVDQSHVSLVKSNWHVNLHSYAVYAPINVRCKIVILPEDEQCM